MWALNFLCPCQQQGWMQDQLPILFSKSPQTEEYRQRGFFTHKAVSSSMALSPALLSVSNLEFYNLKPQPSNQAISSCFLLFYTSNLPFHLVTLWPMTLNHTWLKGTFGLYPPIHTRGLEEALIQMIQVNLSYKNWNPCNRFSSYEIAMNFLNTLSLVPAHKRYLLRRVCWINKLMRP